MANFITHYLENKDKPWDYYELCGNPQVNLDIIKEFPQVYEFSLSENTNLTWDYIVSKKNKINWSWNRISSNPCITWDIIQSNPYEMWDYNGISENINLTWENVLSSPYKPWNTSLLSKHSCITWDIIQSTHDKYYWNPKDVTVNPNITKDIVFENLHYHWDYNQLTKNPNIHLEDILELHNRDILTMKNKICMFYMSCNPNVNWDTIQEYPDLKWDTYCVSFNPNITWDIVLDNPQYPWDVNGLALNPNVTWDIVEQYPNGPQDKKEYNISFWNYKYLSRNKMMS
jgi:hypothetical protein